MTDTMLQLKAAIEEVHKHLPGQHDQLAHGGHDISEMGQNELTALHSEHLMDSLKAQNRVSAANVRMAAAKQKTGGVTGPLSYASAKQELAAAEAELREAEAAYRQSRFDLADIPIYVKHLPGKHDQKEHGRKDVNTVDDKVSVDYSNTAGPEEVQRVIAKVLGPAVTENDIIRAYSGGLDRLPKNAKLVIGIGSAGDDEVQVVGKIMLPSGEKIGSFERSLTKMGKTLQANHETFRIDNKYQGTGYGTEFYYQSEAAYRQMGVDAVRMEADMSVGGYAWARMGFEFESSSSRTAVITQIKDLTTDILDDYVQKNKLAGPEVPNRNSEAWFNYEDKLHSISDKMSAKVLAQMNGMKYPYQLAAMTVKLPNGEQVHVGKKAMLRMKWPAVKRLKGPPSPATKAGNLYRRLRRKAVEGNRRVISP